MIKQTQMVRAEESVSDEQDRGCDQIMGVGFTLLGLFPDITDHISSRDMYLITTVLPSACNNNAFMFTVRKA